MIQVQFQRNLIALEDLLTGVGTVQQTRGQTLVTVTMINGSNLPYDANNTMAEIIASLQAQISSLPNVVDSSGNLLTGLIDSSSSDLSSTHAGRIWQQVISSTQTNVYWGNVLMFEYNQSTGNIITDATAYIAADAVVTANFQAADAVVTTNFQAADATITTDYQAADAAITAAYRAADVTNLATAEAYTDAQILTAADYIDFTINQTQQAAVTANSKVTKTIAYSSGVFVPITVSSNFTLAFNFPVSKVCSMLLAITNGGAYTITWPAGMKFPDGAVPSLTAAGTDHVTVYTDGNNNMFATLVASNVK